ncbi:TIR domain-containing protein [Saccharopolyspora kobensis]|uniref:TIR domain-containing protein n=1 Tax=Saccharopolyspora kobensis TaxID=146035 RepID=A0A1H6EKA5_9PSEU|nr:toll/interleukin-1 receptor domain-containing protein [Saccharopolyspora kobensis]SEG97571.1 TIR domain-containing protein [Saccharopolyspora kobensis]SFE94121.1 TIR domain-containing protein [Saccharopolyspora kobensis]
MSSAKGFLSYVHADDAAESGRIAQLARDVVAQYEMITGEQIDLFLDRDEISWGEDWRSKIDGTLADVAFFIPVLTRRYFRSQECRRELDFFIKKARALGLAELILPILYIDFAELREEPPTDELIARTRAFQWVDWTDLRFAATTSPEYRKAVAQLAQRLAEAATAAEAVDGGDAATSRESVPSAPGFVDVVAEAEEVMPAWTETVRRITAEILRIEELATTAGEAIQASDARGQGSATRNAIFNQFAQELKPPAEQIARLGNEFAAQLHTVDLGMQAVLARIPGELRQNSTSAEDVHDFFDLVRQMASGSAEGLGALKELVSTIEPVERESRNLRPVLRELRKGLTLMVDGDEVIQNWVKQMDGLQVPPRPESG